MRATLRSLDSVDAPDGLESFIPENPQCFAVAVSAVIGPADGLGGELFYFKVCSPQWIEKNPPPEGFEFMHGYLVLSRWDYRTLHRAVNDLCLHTEAEDWEQLATSLSRYGSWEFADYRE